MQENKQIRIQVMMYAEDDFVRQTEIEDYETLVDPEEMADYEPEQYLKDDMTQMISDGYPFEDMVIHYFPFRSEILRLTIIQLNDDGEEIPDTREEIGCQKKELIKKLIELME